jgi:hypothetical protein
MKPGSPASSSQRAQYRTSFCAFAGDIQGVKSRSSLDRPQRSIMPLLPAGCGDDPGEADAPGLGDEPEQLTVAGERPSPPDHDQLQRRLVGAVEQSVAGRTARLLERDLDRLIAEPFDLDDLGRGAGDQTAHRTTWSQPVESGHFDPKRALIDRYIQACAPKWHKNTVQPV